MKWAVAERATAFPNEFNFRGPKLLLPAEFDFEIYQNTGVQAGWVSGIKLVKRGSQNAAIAADAKAKSPDVKTNATLSQTGFNGCLRKSSQWGKIHSGILRAINADGQFS